MLFYFLLIFSNPGIQSADNKSTFLELIENNIKINDYCPVCIIPKTYHTRHCFYCDICVLELDHHCYWVSNCIGANNFKRFVFFTFLVIINLLTNIYTGSYTLINSKYFNYDENIYKKHTLPPFFPILDEFYHKNFIVFFCSSLIILSICFLIPVSILFIYNMKICFFTIKFHKKDRHSFLLTSEEEKTLLKNSE